MTPSLDAVLVIAAPSGGEFGDAGWWIVGAVVMLWLISLFFMFLDGWKMRKHSYEEQVEVFLEDLRSGAVTRRGHIRLNPLKYTKLRRSDADRIAQEAGYYRQTFGTQGQWLFFRPAESCDERK